MMPAAAKQGAAIGILNIDFSRMTVKQFIEFIFSMQDY
jgi:hypothetical protein